MELLPFGGYCTADCERQFNEGDRVTLTANALHKGDKFLGWQGDCSISRDEVCQVTLSGDQIITVRFYNKPALYWLLIVLGTSGALLAGAAMMWRRRRHQRTHHLSTGHEHMPVVMLSPADARPDALHHKPHSAAHKTSKKTSAHKSKPTHKKPAGKPGK